MTGLSRDSAGAGDAARSHNERRPRTNAPLARAREGGVRKLADASLRLAFSIALRHSVSDKGPSAFCKPLTVQ